MTDKADKPAPPKIVIGSNVDPNSPMVLKAQALFADIFGEAPEVEQLPPVEDEETKD